MMSAGLRAARAWGLTIALVLIPVSQAREASAMIYFLTGAPPPGTSWLIICNDGASLTLSGTYQTAVSFGFGWCFENHGGVANITDASVQSALATIQTCDQGSSITLARDLGQGNYEAMTAEGLATVLAGSQGNPVELTGYTLVGLNLGGTELHPNPVPNLPAIPITHIYSDEDDDGQTVGGRTVPASCAATVPLHPALAPLIGLLLAALGAASIAARQAKPGERVESVPPLIG